MASGGQHSIPCTPTEKERVEYERIADLPHLMRAPGLSRIFAFVCEKYFERKIEEIKEYTIAVHALGRPENFDSGSDPIVRVSMRSLRKRLEQYYANEGKDHTLQITFPVGHYVPEFVHAEAVASQVASDEQPGLRPELYTPFLPTRVLIA